MKKIALLLLTVLILTACPNIYEVPERVQLKINVVGLDFLSEEADSLKSAPMDIFTDFEHNYSHTDIYLFREDAQYNLSTGSIGQGVHTSISVGTYEVNGYGGYSSPYGIGELSFTIPDQKVVVETGSTSIDIEAFPDCGLILIADDHDLVETTFISGDGTQGVEFSQVGYYRYTYFRPQSSFQAHIIKKDGAELVLNTGDLNTGRIYKIVIAMD